MAMLVVLETLTPGRARRLRIAEVFGFSHDVAAAIGSRRWPSASWPTGHAA